MKLTILGSSHTSLLERSLVWTVMAQTAVDPTHFCSSWTQHIIRNFVSLVSPVSTLSGIVLTLEGMWSRKFKMFNTIKIVFLSI